MPERTKQMEDSLEYNGLKDHDKPPAYRWVILFTTWFAFLLSYIDRVAWSSVAVPVGKSIGIPISLLGAFVTAFYVGYVIANVAGGLLTDTIGARRTLAYALFPLGLSTFAFSYIQSFVPGLFIQALMGLAAGADYSAGMKMLAVWFGKDRGVAMGFYGTATSLAVVVSNASVPRISAAYGWEAAFRLIGVVTLAWAGVCLFLLRDAPARQRVLPAISRGEILALFRNRNLLIIAVSGFCGFWATVGFSAWGNALMTKRYGIPPIAAGSILSAFGVGAIVAKPLLGWVRDRVGARSQKILPILCLLGFSIMLIVFSRCSTIGEFYAVAPVLGATAFGYTPLLYVLLTEASGTKSAGAASGLTNAVWQAGATLSPMAVGVVFAQNQSFELALETLALGPVLAAILLCFLSYKPST